MAGASSRQPVKRSRALSPGSPPAPPAVAQWSVADDDEPCRRMRAPPRWSSPRGTGRGSSPATSRPNGHDERAGHGRSSATSAAVGSSGSGAAVRMTRSRSSGNATTHRTRQVVRDGSHHVGPGEDACCQRVPRRRHADERGDNTWTGSPPTGACGQRHGRHADVHRVEDVRPAAGELAPQPQRVRRRPTVRHHGPCARDRFELTIEFAASSPHQHVVPAGSEPSGERRRPSARRPRSPCSS